MALGIAILHYEARFVDLYRRRNGRPSQRKERASQLAQILRESALDSATEVTMDDIFEAYNAIVADWKGQPPEMVLPDVYGYQFTEYSIVNTPADGCEIWEPDDDNTSPQVC